MTNDLSEAAPLRVIARRKIEETEQPFMSLAGLGFTAFTVMAIVGWVAFLAGAV